MVDMTYIKINFKKKREQKNEKFVKRETKKTQRQPSNDAQAIKVTLKNNISLCFQYS